MKSLPNKLFLILIVYLKLFTTITSGYYEDFFTTKMAANYNYAQRRNIENSINRTVEPCENFYEYACGNYKFDNNNKNYKEITQYLDQKFNERLLEVIKPKGFFQWLLMKPKKLLFQTQQTFVDKMQNYFDACVRERRGNFWKYLKELELDWPLTRKFDLKHTSRQKELTAKDFWQLLGQLQSYNKNFLIEQLIEANGDDTFNMFFQHIAFEDANTLPEDEFVKAFLKVVDVSDVKAVMQELQNTQENWLNVLKNKTLTEEDPQEMDLAELLETFPYFSEYLKNLMGTQYHQIANVTLVTPAFFEYLNEIQWSPKVAEQQINFLVIHFFYYLALDGRKDNTPLACVKDMRYKFDFAANYMFLHEVGLKEKNLYEKALNETTSKLTNIFEQFFNSASLNLSSSEILKFKNNLDSITLNIGNLPHAVDFEEINTFYGEVPELANRNYFRNHLLLLKHRFLSTFLHQQSQLNIHLLPDHKPLLASSPYYVPHHNMIVIPFASLQYPLFHYNYNSLYQLSLMGFILGHEIAHAFGTNDLPREYKSHTKFVDYLECLKKQEPAEDIDERISDLMAEQVAFAAYERYYATGHDMGWHRNFYLNMAQFFCNNGALKFISHDTDTLRLQMIVKNSPEFRKAFNCSLGMAMSPKEKCRLF